MSSNVEPALVLAPPESNVPESEEHKEPTTKQLPGQESDPQQEASQNILGVSGIILPWKLPDVEELRKEFAQTYAGDDDGTLRLVNVVKQYSDELVKRWKEEIDTLLVYAGLFSAILTAFNVQSYLLLQPATPDPNLLVLQQISLQLNSFSVTSPEGTLINSTHLVTFPVVRTPAVESWAVWLNSLWFSALICSLSSASIGILIKQWLHEYQAGISGDSREIARLRQYRLNRLEKWRVAQIVAFLPALLQISLFLFFAGLLILLWHYHSTVAIVASILIGAVALFVGATTVMPLVWNDCCYLSTPVYPLYTLAQYVKQTASRIQRSILTGILYGIRQMRRLCVSSRMVQLYNWVRQALDSRPLYKTTTLRGREQSFVQDTSLELDIDMAVHAYSTTIDHKHLSDAGAILTSHGLDAIRRHYQEVKAIIEQHFGSSGTVPATDFWTGVVIYNVDETETNHHGVYNINPTNATPSTYHRLLLTLAAKLVNPKGDYFPLVLLKRSLSADSSPLELMPWDVVRYVAAAAELCLDQLLRSSDIEVMHWQHVFFAVEVLVRCCFTPVSSWRWSHEDKGVVMRWILKMDFLQKQELLSIASWVSDFYAIDILHTLALILTYLDQSVDLWSCRAEAETLLETVRDVLEPASTHTYQNAVLLGVPDTYQRAIAQLKRKFEDCRSRGLGGHLRSPKLQIPVMKPLEESL